MVLKPMPKLTSGSQLPPAARPFVPEPLEIIGQKVAAGDTSASIETRTLLKWFGYERRTPYAVDLVRRALGSLQLITVPDFESAFIDKQVHFVRRSDQAADTRPNGLIKSGNAGEAVNQIDDPTFRLGKLAAANRVPVSVKPDDDLSVAVTTMMASDFSQLPVMSGERTLRGVVTWASIGGKLALTPRSNQVRDYYDVAPDVLSINTSMFVAVDHIARRGFVLVHDDTRKITGIVTSTDVTEIFRDLGEPFLLLGEIENYLRRLIGNRFSSEQLRKAVDPSDGGRDVTSAANLSFGEYIRLLSDPDKWRCLDINVARPVFLKDLETIRGIRNNVMHFDPDGLAPAELHALRSFAQFLRNLAHCGVIQSKNG